MWKRVCAVFLVFAVGGPIACGDDNGSNNGGNDSNANNTNDEPEAFSEDCTTMIAPADEADENRASINSAIVEPSDGDVICLGDGTYDINDQLTLNASDVSNIEIRGESQDGTVLDFDEQEDGSNGILVDGIDGFRAASFTIKNTLGDAIKVQNGDGVELVDLTVTWDGGAKTSNGAYGIYPVLDQNVLVEGCEVSYASDAGIYVGQTDTAIVRDNVAFGNVAGVEIENTSNAEVYENEVYDNTGGILVFNLPDLQVRDGSHNKIHSNVIEDNNRSSFAESGTIVSRVPAGTGILLLSTDRNEIHDNEIRDNDSIGVVIASYLILGQSVDDEDYDAYSEANFVHDNTFENIGQNPSGLASSITEDDSVPELVIDGFLNPELEGEAEFTDVRDCFDANETPDGEASFLNFNASEVEQPPIEPTDCSEDWTDFCHYQCTRDPLPEVTL